VYVTSGDQAKIDKAVKLGATGGVSYKEKDWEKKVQAMLPKERRFLDAIVDGAGGDVVSKGSRLLKVSSIWICCARIYSGARRMLTWFRLVVSSLSTA
jgi:NADPH:quinone reductase-like Zn-dependent oxidoreductase